MMTTLCWNYSASLLPRHGRLPSILLLVCIAALLAKDSRLRLPTTMTILNEEYSLPSLFSSSTISKATTTTDASNKDSSFSSGGSATTAFTNKIPGAKTSIEPVRWERDEAWFLQEASQKGCCPYAKYFYNDRYSKIDNRCCTSRWWKNGNVSNPHMIAPLRPVGGLDFDEFLEWVFATSNIGRRLRRLEDNNTSTTTTELSIFWQGDSLAEQHFISFLCLAWSSSTTVKIDMLGEKNPNMYNHTARLVATTSTISNQNQRVEMMVKYARQNRPNENEYLEREKDVKDSDIVILGGWHHGEVQKLPATLDVIQQIRGSNKMTVVVEALPGHQPGGKFKKNGKYDAPKVDFDIDPALPPMEQPACNKYNSIENPPGINQKLRQKLHNNNTNSSFSSGISLLEVEYLYHERGDAHPEWIGAGGRDCLHYCVAPGVLEALARQTLGHIATRYPTTTRRSAT